MPLVSVIVTVYNRADYLSATLDSILASHFQNFEVIIVDDCSQDDSVQIAQAFAKQDGRIELHRNTRNLGDYANRNRAASLSKGKYLKYLDADDLIYSHSLGLMVEALESNPAAGLALSSNVIDPEAPYPSLLTPREVYSHHFLGRSPLGVGPSAAIIRRCSFEAIGGFSGAQFVGDIELWLKLAERWPVVALPPALVWWRRHAEQQFELEHKQPEVLNIRYALQLDMLSATQHLDDAEKQEARRYLEHLHARRLLSYGIKQRRFRAAWSLIQASGLNYQQVLAGLRRPPKRVKPRTA